MEVLSSYVRRNAPWVQKDYQTGDAEDAPQGLPRTDIQAILTVLGRRRRGKELERGERLNLTMCDLRGANLRGVHLENANLGKAHLEGARLNEAHLEKADLGEAHLEGAYGIAVEQVRSANHWENAHYDSAFAIELGLEGPESQEAEAGHA